jgi:hypothetical protein
MRGFAGKVVIALLIVVLAFFLSAQLPMRPMTPINPTPYGRPTPDHPHVDESPSSPEEIPPPVAAP